MTMKQFHRYRFLRLLDAYREAKRHIDTPEGKDAFIVLSVQIHAAKAHVPKSWWPMVNKVFREA